MNKVCLSQFLFLAGCQRNLSPAGESEGQMGSACVLLPEINFRRTCHTDGPRPDPVYRPDTKCFLVFSPGGLHNTSARMIKQLQQHMYTEHGCLPVIAGGIVKQVWIEPSPSSRWVFGKGARRWRDNLLSSKYSSTCTCLPK